ELAQPLPNSLGDTAERVQQRERAANDDCSGVCSHSIGTHTHTHIDTHKHTHTHTHTHTHANIPFHSHSVFHHSLSLFPFSFRPLAFLSSEMKIVLRNMALLRVVRRP